MIGRARDRAAGMPMGLRGAAILLALLLIGRAFPAASAETSLAAVHAAQPAPDLQKELRLFAETMVSDAGADLGVSGGFYRTPQFHIGLPRTLDNPVSVLDKVYAPLLAVTLERTINRSAEATAAPARDAILASLGSVTFADPARVVDGAPDAVTVAVRTQLEPRLRELLRPMIAANLDAAGARSALARMRARYEAVANVPFPDFDIDAYTLDSFLTVFFADMAQHEQDVRVRPSARSTDAMKRLFSSR